jgi:pyruvate/2-oxoglutarate dehydrogenase complex dihydrolipoamide dehydrogenase (E3) component
VEIPFDEVIVAVGRRAHTESLGLAELGIGLNRDGTVVVDEYLRTSVPNIFACGDVAGPYQFTHMASHQAWYAAVNALFGRFRKFKVNLRRGAVGDVHGPGSCAGRDLGGRSKGTRHRRRSDAS